MKKSERMCHVLGRWLLFLCLLMGVSGCVRKEDEFFSLSELGEEAGAPDSSGMEGAGGPQDLSGSSGKAGEQDVSAGSNGAVSSDVSTAPGGAGSSEFSAALGGAAPKEPQVTDSSSAPDGAGQADTSVSCPDTASKDARIYVDVCGAVAAPGVYRLKAGSRVFQAVKRAGGLLPGAAGEYVNQARSLADGDQIYIPTRDEAEALHLPEPEGRTGKNAGKEASTKDGEISDGGKVNLNTADLAALTTLTGIGESRARAILAYREEHGGFSSIEEICSVQGIKEGTFGRIKDKIVIE